MKRKKRENNKNAQIVTNQAFLIQLQPAVSLLLAVDQEAGQFIQWILAKPAESWNTQEIQAIEQMVIAAQQLEVFPEMEASKIKADLADLKKEAN